MSKIDKVYIGLFIALYIAVGLVSTIHAVSFFSLANVLPLAILLAVAFEIGQAAVLFSILTDERQRKRFMPWCLMCILTLVQVIGNVYSSYKYLITNSIDMLRFFKEPIFVWGSIPDDVANVLLTYIIGAILPLVSLALSEMVTERITIRDLVEEVPESENDNLENTELESTKGVDELDNPVEETESESEEEIPERESGFINL